jgi:hypothetical protein
MNMPTPEESKAYLAQGLNSLGETRRKSRERCVLVIKESFGDKWDTMDAAEQAKWVSMQVDLDDALEATLVDHLFS